MTAPTTARQATDPVLVSADSHVLTITLNRPDVHNAVNLDMAQRISDALDRLDDDPDLRVGIIAANGRSFCAGMDLKAFARGEVPRPEPRGFAGIVKQPPAKPLVAAVEGAAVGGGFEIVLACDLIVASESARFSLPEVTRGLTPNGGGLLRLPRRIPHHLAMELILTGRPVTAARAAELGLLNRLTPPGSALSTARELAAVIAANGPLAIRAAKRVVEESPDWPRTEMFTRQEDIVAPVRSSADAAEGARAFAEKRMPLWRNR
ncbi:crotonase/enoyl-CoA hydratase family protein [Mycolicibacterium thermoresistibile]|uniref:Enoyl-CoA hydratase n=2 Tax=Mycolicibacterium thermoresistibile TaxID=1797 RepID=G7CH49_MYCT3|nr:crotonase/enoyl-CoA hydratase family protein [Mycolicibacterium thermoresistibile]EHI12159.1 enoyl-CoA hydratase [Mycolicibacterium thermoresistibile ATCC 19527]MCV7191126.1 crotonase/enoyl-CoA hydratase family protein [Mycolicibacterium thermoresistibile]GAT15526.1 enoyl-CoA hydratase/isomerase [Mycolicibacterium thermoresistibile]SNW16923.1 putative enoyl-CoA hydratase [Mycolicibacterium thermoresistibile]